MEELYVDSLEDFKDNRFNYYDKFHIDKAKTVDITEETIKAVEKNIMELRAQLMREINPMIEVKVK